jgi:hypothetical protein
MKRALVFLALLFAAARVVPQDAPQDPRFTTKIETAADGSTTLSITNRSQASITALTIFSEHTDSTGRVRPYSRIYFDSVTNARIYPEIRALETREFKLFQPSPLVSGETRGGTIQAIIFGDGSSYGDDASVNYVLRSREFVWRNVSAVLETLAAAKSTPLSKEELLQRLDENQKTESEERRKSALISAVPIASSAFQNFQTNLKLQDTPSIPASLIDQLSGQYLDLRRLLVSSKPQIPGTEQAVEASSVPPRDFEVKLSPGLKSETVFVSYSLRGAPSSGVPGIGTTLRPPSGAQILDIPTMISGKPAHSLQALIIGKGCQIKIIDVPDLAASTRTADYECIKLPTVEITGRVVNPSEVLAGHAYRVRIVLQGVGSLLDYDLAFVTPDDNGVFHAQITDYSQDPACTTAAPNGGGYLVFQALPVKSGEYGARLDAVNSQYGYLRLTPDFGGEVLLRVHAN